MNILKKKIVENVYVEKLDKIFRVHINRTSKTTKNAKKVFYIDVKKSEEIMGRYRHRTCLLYTSRCV